MLKIIRDVQVWIVILLLAGAASPAIAHTRSPSPEYVDSLLPAYLAVQAGLGENDVDAAKASAKPLLAAAIRGPKNLSLSSSIGRIAKARDLATARRSFVRLTSAMLHLVEEVGTTGKTNLFLWECSQTEASGSDIWLQSDRVARDPYHPENSLECPKIQRKLVHQLP